MRTDIIGAYNYQRRGLHYSRDNERYERDDMGFKIPIDDDNSNAVYSQQKYI